MGSAIKVVALGNALLDTTIQVSDDFLLRKYNLKSDDQKEISLEEMQRLTKDIAKFDKAETAGGCAQNSLRVIQWLLHQKWSTTICGVIGEDPEGSTLEALLKEDGVQTQYLKSPSYPTGKTIALVNGAQRSLVAHLGAAEQHSLQTPPDRNLLKEADLVYMEGFFVTNRAPLALSLAKFTKEHKRKFAFNISAPYICEEEPETVVELAMLSDILFGNRREYEALSELMKITKIDSLLYKLSANGRIVVVTDASNPVICQMGEEIHKIEIAPVRKEEIVDTTACGDAFVGGFLTGYLLTLTLPQSVDLGNYAAGLIIRRRGCSLPDTPPLHNFLPL